MYTEEEVNKEDSSIYPVKVDLYKHESRWKNWKSYYLNNDIEDISKKNSNITKKYVFDLEIGENVTSRAKKGARSFSRLNAVAEKSVYITKLLEKRYNVLDLTKVQTSQLLDLFAKMRNGEIKTKRGTNFKSTADYVKIMKAFWHWHQKVNRINGKSINDITEDLDGSYDQKPKWVSLDEKQMDKLIEKADMYYRPLLAFLYDSGARPTEVFSLVAEDIYQDSKGTVYVNIRDNISKGSKCGRKIKLMLCGKEIIDYIKKAGLEGTDRLFSQSNIMANRYMGELAKKLFGEGNSLAGEKYSGLTLYDFRHNSCCYWLRRYKNNSSLMYRFGWRTEKYIHYYSEFLGMKDPIQEEDMYIDITKTELEKRISIQERDIEVLKQSVNNFENWLGDLKNISQLQQPQLMTFNDTNVATSISGLSVDLNGKKTFFSVKKKN